MVYGGFLTLTYSHLHHYWHFSTMVGFCHGGNMLGNHDNVTMMMMMTMMMMCSCLTRFTACSKLTPSLYSSDRTDVILCQIFFSWLFPVTPQMRMVDLLFPCVQTSNLSNRPIDCCCWDWLCSFNFFPKILKNEEWRCPFLKLSSCSRDPLQSFQERLAAAQLTSVNPGSRYPGSDCCIPWRLASTVTSYNATCCNVCSDVAR